MLQGQLARAEAELTEVRDTNEKHGIKDDYANYYLLGEVRRLNQDADKAVTLDRQALALARQNTGENSEPTATAHYHLGLALRDSGDAANAEAELRAALAAFANFIPKAEHPAAATTRLELGKLLAALSESAMAINLGMMAKARLARSS